MTDKGVSFTVTHEPCPRSRALFVLDETFSFLKGGTKKERDNEWKKRYDAFCRSLDLPYDKACIDPARLMYLPALAKDADITQHEFRIIAGRMVDIYADAAIEKASGNAYGSSRPNGSTGSSEVAPGDDNPFVAASKGVPGVHNSAGTGQVRSGERFKPKTTGLLEFIAKYPDFDPIMMLADHAPQDFRGRNNTDTKIEFMCPYEEGHSSSDPEQVPFFVSTENEGRWHMGCQTDGCKTHGDGDRLYFLDALIQKYDIPPMTVFGYSPSRCAAIDKKIAVSDVAQAEKKDDIKAQFEALTPELTEAENIACLEILKGMTSEFERTKHIKIMSDRTGLPASTFRRDLKTLTEREDEEDKDSEVDPQRGVELGQIWARWPFPTQCDVLRRIIAKKNAKALRLFKRPEGEVARLVRPSGDKPYIAYMNHDAWTNELNKMASYHCVDEGGYVTVRPLHSQLQAAIRGETDLDIPVLKRITDIPLYAADGTLRTRPGYDPVSKTYLVPGFKIIEPPGVGDVTEDHLNDAIHILRVEAMNDFPFSDIFDGTETAPIYGDDVDSDGHKLPNPDRGASSFANMLGLILHSFVDAMIDGPKPSYHIDKPKMATGAGYLMNVATIIRTGAAASVTTLADTEDEIRKEIVASRRSGGEFLFFDNINKRISSSAIAAYETATTFEGRILGISENAKIPTDVPVIFAGNNLDFTGEHYRRKVPIRMDAGTANPRERTYFKQKHLMTWLKANRSRMVWAVYVLVNNWLQEGKPAPVKDLHFASYDEYPRVIGGILDAAGAGGFLDNHRAYFAAKNNEDTGETELAVKSYEAFGDAIWFTTAEMFDVGKDKFTGKWSIECVPLDTRDDGKAIHQLSRYIGKHMEGNTFQIHDKSWKLAVDATASPKRWRWIFNPE